MATRHDSENSQFWEMDIDLAIIPILGNAVFLITDLLHKWNLWTYHDWCLEERTKW